MNLGVEAVKHNPMGGLFSGIRNVRLRHFGGNLTMPRRGGRASGLKPTPLPHGNTLIHLTLTFLIRPVSGTNGEDACSVT